MLSRITLAEIPVASIVYAHDTRLFPFSPRRAIDPNLVERLKRSIAETGMWQPVVVQAGTMEGIAGNHRFLAYLEVAAENGLIPETLTIPAVLVDCDEGDAVTIGLIENELREDLTQWETVRALLKAVERKPQVVETVFEVDGATVEQLRLWPAELDYDAEAEARRRALQARLTRQWIALINDRLAEYPELRAYFLEQLRHPTWVQARSLDELDRSITRALLSHGVRFEIGKTWNSMPASQCLGCSMTFEELCQALRPGKGSLNLQPDGAVPGCCRYLRLFPRYVQQFVPDAGGNAVLQTSSGHEAYPYDTLTADNQSVRGEIIPLLDDVDAYCIAPDVHEIDSCLHRQEARAAQMMVQALIEEGLPAVLPGFIQEREGIGEFVWRCPKREGNACTPETCVHAQDDPAGFVVMAQMDRNWEMVCINAECGQAAQEALVDWEAEERRRERQRWQVALDGLRRVSIERTLLAPADRSLDLSVRSLMEAVETVLVPEWDTPTMFHVVLGWQAAMRARIAVEMGIDDLAAREVSQAFRERCGQLADTLTNDTIVAAYMALRERMAQSDEGLHRWVACLALVRTWRDQVETTDQVAEATWRVAAYGQGETPVRPSRAE